MRFARRLPAIASMVGIVWAAGCGTIKPQTGDAQVGVTDGGSGGTGGAAADGSSGGGDGGFGGAGGAVETHAELLARLAAAETRWTAVAPTCPSYRYSRSTARSVFHVWRSTIVRVEANQVVSRDTMWGGGYGPEAEGRWTEDASTLGTHPNGTYGTSGFPPSTAEQLLAECRAVLEKDPTRHSFYLTTNEQGVPVGCGSRPLNCQDDCTTGILLDSFGCGDLRDPVDLTGSYDVQFSSNAVYRVHLTRSASAIDGYDGLIASNSAVPCIVTLQSDRIVIQRCMIDLRLGRAADGSLDGTATYWTLPTGTVTKDVAPPTIQITPTFTSEKPPLLPWRPIPLTFRDAVDPAQLRQLLTIRTGRAATVPVTLGASPPETLFNKWVGVLGVTATFPWDDIAGTTVTFDVAAGLRGFSGATAPALSLAAPVAAVGTAVAEHQFDGTTVDVATWGAAGLAVGDPGCDTGSGCLKLGPPLISCEGPGMAGILAAPPGATTIEFRVRLVNAGPGSAREVWMGMTIIPEGGQPVPSQAKASLPLNTIDDLGPAAGEIRWATEWRTIQFALPTGVSPTRWAFEMQLHTTCAPITPPETLSHRVLIDSVTIR